MISGTRLTELGMETGILKKCVSSCFETASACLACADESMGKAEMRQMAGCIRLCLDCADVCDATGKLLSRRNEPDIRVWKEQLHSCITVTDECRKECIEKSAQGPFCTACAEKCRECGELCVEVLGVLDEML